MRNFLTNVWTICFSTRDCFIKDCNDDPNTYQKPIKPQKIKNSASEAGSCKVSSKNKSLVSVSMARNPRSRSILYHVLQAEVDMKQIIRYPLTLVSLSISDVGGIMQKSPKLKLLQELEKRVPSNPPTNVEVTIIDGMFFFSLAVQTSIYRYWPGRSFVKTSLQTRGAEIHLVIDKTISPSAKETERNKRSNQRGMVYQITRPEQKQSTNWLQALRGGQFKEALLKFLVDYL